MITNIKRRSFLKVAATLGGGFTLGIAWASDVKAGFIKTAAEDWTGINAYLSISPSGKITIMSTNPEIGQNIKTAFPMIVADELGADWKDVIVEQAALDTVNFKRQVAGGSQSIRFSFDLLRQAGATARQMLINAAAETWGIDPSLCKAEMSKVVYNGKSLSYGELANKAGKMPKPENVPFKEIKDFHIIGSSQKNVDADKILSGNQKYGIDIKREGMLYASIKKPDGFGQVIVSVDDAKTRAIPGVVDVVQFDEKVVVLAKDTWTAMKGKKALSVTYKSDKTLEDSEVIDKKLVELLNGAGEVKRNDGDVDKAFAEADQIVEKTYEAPFLPHNCMEPMNFFADVQADKAHLEGP
ncbi:MAG TPA: molybdopterin-dependent oxidoreductase, partial [Saprospiraceae bacterium]|nr:molybdopterin-dependent oxidoreductase [Saprospiraceae bacterium]